MADGRSQGAAAAVEAIRDACISSVTRKKYAGGVKGIKKWIKGVYALTLDDGDTSKFFYEDDELNLNEFTPSMLVEFLAYKRKTTKAVILSGYRSAIKATYDGSSSSGTTNDCHQQQHHDRHQQQQHDCHQQQQHDRHQHQQHNRNKHQQQDNHRQQQYDRRQRWQQRRHRHHRQRRNDGSSNGCTATNKRSSNDTATIDFNISRVKVFPESLRSDDCTKAKSRTVMTAQIYYTIIYIRG